MKGFSLFFTLMIFMFSTFAADNMYTPKTQGSVQIIDNTGRIWEAQVSYTTDGSGNVIPISGGGGGSGLTDAQLRASAVPVSLPSATQAASLAVSSTSGTITSGATSVSFLVSSRVSATVAGAALAQGESVSFQAQPGQTLGAITYDGTGSVLRIAVVR